MKTNKPAWVSGIIVGIFILSSGVPAEYYSGGGRSHNIKAAKHACKDRIREKIWSDHANARKVEFHSGSIDAWRETNAKTGVKGKGRFLNAKQRWREFEFKCVYSNPQDRIVSASYRKVSGGWNDNDQDYGGGDYGYGTRRSQNACKRSVARIIHRQHPNSSDVKWVDRTVEGTRESGSRIRYEGQGRFVGGRGKRRSFDFSCIYDFGDNDVLRAAAITH